ncbi:hypothetical protein HOD08_04295 [bacterium]|nr:hypothetical protein [bacterium]
MEHKKYDGCCNAHEQSQKRDGQTLEHGPKLGHLPFWVQHHWQGLKGRVRYGLECTKELARKGYAAFKNRIPGRSGKK